MDRPIAVPAAATTLEDGAGMQSCNCAMRSCSYAILSCSQAGGYMWFSQQWCCRDADADVSVNVNVDVDINIDADVDVDDKTRHDTARCLCF